MKRRSFIGAVLTALALASPAAAGTDWPKGPVRLVVPSKAGGGTDVMGRIFADYLQRAIGRPVAVINQPGGGGTVGYEMVRTAVPDGQTLLFMHTSLMIHAHTGRYPHPVSDFTPIAMAQIYPSQVYAVGADAPWNTLSDFVEDARANPGKLTVGVSLGGTTHFMAGMIEQSAGIKLKMVEASAEVDKVAAIQGGHIDMGNLGARSAQQFVSQGKMKVISLIDPVPNPDFPEFTPALQQGLDMSWQTPLILFGPAGMDPAVVEAINAATRGMVEDPAILESHEKMGNSYAYKSVEETQALVAEEDARIKNLATTLDITAN
ncbi:tripartite tricarboxylate transporter substrate binding protein [Salipiger thiooxidans]|uniref:tripartite tricarboxylate transporter substrate binding protein n=1 Tax=Salipiger thiooxidans TaxID=282683 RepID=UPI001CD1B82E|nr:tripartite tricarboxylate transporter substrate binding protein [Salipiger thiooxidans]MCA0851054.1 tripartite tricarboxylate transporter substrate binding protein [Salipiger thiooxidans]